MTGTDLLFIVMIIAIFLLAQYVISAKDKNTELMKQNEIYKEFGGYLVLDKSMDYNAVIHRMGQYYGHSFEQYMLEMSAITVSSVVYKLVEENKIPMETDTLMDGINQEIDQLAFTPEFAGWYNAYKEYLSEKTIEEGGYDA